LKLCDLLKVQSPDKSLTNSPEGQQPYEGAPEYTGVRDASEAIWLSLLEKENTL